MGSFWSRTSSVIADESNVFASELNNGHKTYSEGKQCVITKMKKFNECLSAITMDISRWLIPELTHIVVEYAIEMVIDQNANICSLTCGDTSYMFDDNKYNVSWTAYINGRNHMVTEQYLKADRHHEIKSIQLKSPSVNVEWRLYSPRSGVVWNYKLLYMNDTHRIYVGQGHCCGIGIEHIATGDHLGIHTSLYDVDPCRYAIDVLRKIQRGEDIDITWCQYCSGSDSQPRYELETRHGLDNIRRRLKETSMLPEFKTAFDGLITLNDIYKK